MRVKHVSHMEKCLSCDSISTARNFTTKACQETFKIQSGLLNVTPKKFFIYYNSKSGKAKTKSYFRQL